MPKPRTGTFATPTDNADHKALIALIDGIMEHFDTIEELKSDYEKWKAEKVQTFKSGAVRDERKVALITTLDTKLGMVPHAIQREQEALQAKTYECSKHVGPLLTAAEAMLNQVSDELMETMTSSVGLWIESEDSITEAASYLFHRTEFGRRSAELYIMRTHPPVRNHGDAIQQAVWFGEVAKLHAAWLASKMRAGKVPTSENAA